MVLNEPAVIAFDRDSRNVLAVGEEARRMLGRTPSNIDAIRPLQKGMVADILMIAAVQLLSTLTGTDPHTRPS